MEPTAEVKQENGLSSNHTMDDDLTTNLQELLCLLQHEQPKWYHSDHSRTADKISEYITAIDLLLVLAREHNLTAFVLAFNEMWITAEGIRHCFFSASSRTQRRRAQCLLSCICDSVVGKIKEGGLLTK
jgi:hypothetical protein